MTGEVWDTVRDPDRLEALKRTMLVDTAAEEAFDRLTRLASRILDAPVALVSLVDEQRQFFKSCIGLDEPWASTRETPLSHSFCQHVVATAEPLVVPDATADPRLCDNLAIRDLGVVAYAGIPLRTSEGHVLGSFCAIDTKPRDWRDADIDILGDLAAAAMTEIERQAAVHAADQARQRLELLTDAMPAEIAYVDAEQRYQFVNAAYPKRFKRSRDNILGRTVREVVGETTYDRIVPHITDALSGKSQWFELRLDDPAGTTFNDVTYVPHRDADGKVLGFYGLVLDITARMQADHLAAEHLERATLALEAGRMGIWEWQVQSDRAIWSKELCAMLGVRPGSEPESGHSLFLKSVHFDDRSRIANLIAEETRQQRGHRFECRIVRPDGEVRWLYCQSIYKADPIDGDRVIGLCIDTSERKKTEQALQDSEARHRLALESAGMGTFEIDLVSEQAIIDAQEARLLGFPEETRSVPVAAVQERLHPADQPTDAQLRALTENRGEPYHNEFRIMGPDGSERWLASYATAQFDGTGKATHVFGVNLDVTERKQTEQKQKLLIDELNHRVRNTLAIVISLANQTWDHAELMAAFVPAFNGRIQCLATAHSLLTESEWGTSTLANLIDQQMQPYAQRPGAFTSEGPAVLIAPKPALSLSLVFHELATNAAAYGAFSNQTGRVAVAWYVTNAEGVASLAVRWTEADGPPVQAPTQTHFGTKIVEFNLRHEFQGRMIWDYHPEGLRCLLTIPLSNVLIAD